MEEETRKDPTGAPQETPAERLDQELGKAEVEAGAVPLNQEVPQEELEVQGVSQHTERPILNLQVVSPALLEGDPRDPGTLEVTIRLLPTDPTDQPGLMAALVSRFVTAEARWVRVPNRDGLFSLVLTLTS